MQGIPHSSFVGPPDHQDLIYLDAFAELKPLGLLRFGQCTAVS